MSRCAVFMKLENGAVVAVVGVAAALAAVAVVARTKSRMAGAVDAARKLRQQMFRMMNSSRIAVGRSISPAS